MECTYRWPLADRELSPQVGRAGQIVKLAGAGLSGGNSAARSWPALAANPFWAGYDHQSEEYDYDSSSDSRSSSYDSEESIDGDPHALGSSLYGAAGTTAAPPRAGQGWSAANPLFAVDAGLEAYAYAGVGAAYSSEAYQQEMAGVSSDETYSDTESTSSSSFSYSDKEWGLGFVSFDGDGGISDTDDDGTYVSDGEGSSLSSSGDTTVSPYSPVTIKHEPAVGKLEPKSKVGPTPSPISFSAASPRRRRAPAAPP
jgi:hypothetical protein